MNNNLLRVVEKRKYQLILYSLGLVCVVYICFIVFRNFENKKIEYFGPYGVYLLLLFIGCLIFKEKTRKTIDRELKIKYLYYIVAFIPVIATFLVAFLPTILNMRISLIIITIIYGILNGTLEELFWRYTYNSVNDDNLLMSYIIPTIIFTCWHFALLLCKDMSYHGGAIATVGGAGFMGAIWGYVMFRTKNVMITIIAHVFVNIFAFSQLLYYNF